MEIGRNFKADYVVELEVNQISLYEPGSYNTLFRGRCDISMVVIDVHKSSEGPKCEGEYSTEFPESSGTDRREPTAMSPSFVRSS